MAVKSKLQKKKDNPNSLYWKKKADKAWGEYIHSNDSCLICDDSSKKLEAHHLVSRAVTHLRHDPENGILLCSWHHKFDPGCSPHAGPIGFSEWLKENYPNKHEYVLTNRYKTGKPNYKESYENLTKGKQ